MEWLKKNYDQFVLLCFAALLCGVATFLIFNAMAFHDIFARISGQVQINRNIPPSDAAALATAKQAVQNPRVWNRFDGAGSLLVSEPYILYRVNHVIRPMNPEVTLHMFHPPIPNKWFYDNHIDPLDPNALEDDPSGDGFSNLEKWNWKCDPLNPESHPPYWTKLRLLRFIKIPFRLKFEAYDGAEFQINTIDLRQPSQFLHVSDQITGTKFKIIGFDKKTHTDANGVEVDDSELTIQNLETKEKLALILNKVIDSPDSYALFLYTWKGNAKIQVKKDKTFSVAPENDVQYKLVDIDVTRALIQSVKTGEKVTVTQGTAEKAQ